MYMSNAKNKFRHPLTVLFASLCCAAVTFPLLAAAVTDPLPANGTSAHPQPALVNLIIRLRESGTLKQDEAAELIKLAEADAADARVQSALVALANAQAEAAQVRADANAIQATTAKNVQPKIDSPAAVSVVTDTTPAVTDTVAAVAAAPVAATRSVAQPEPVAPARPSAKQPSPDDDEVRVTYVPEVVKAQLREEIKNEVMEQAKQEHWAAPRSFPDWVSRISFYGDFRFRYEGIYNHQQNKDFVGNANFWNYNSINTGSPYDTSNLINNKDNPPMLNIDQDRSRLRVRARLGVAIDLGEGFTSGIRFATGENNSPVTQNQTLGAAGSGQGGNFSKFSLWLDRAFLKYQTGADTSRALTFTVGRFENPFLSTSIIWADDLGFDGAFVNIPAQIHYDSMVVEAVKPYFVVGAFPIFNTDLNFSSTWPDKYKSNDKWLEAAQFGVDLKFGRDLHAKFGTAYYYFTKTVGNLSTPYEPVVATDGGDTDARRPAFAQKGNTYMALRSIIDTQRNLINGVQSNRWQYYGLATPFRDVVLDGRLDYTHFEPFQISLLGEYIANTAFHRSTIRARGFGPVNNLGASDTNYVGGGTAWIVGLKLGDAALQKRWDWNVSINYRNVESDAVIDGFCDSDFGGGGTNLKGLTLGANLALAKRVSLGVKWMSASEVSGPTFKNDILQIDLNGKF